MTTAYTTFMFAGLGAQYYGMGSDLYQSDAIFRSHVEDLDSIVVDVTGESIVGIISGAGSRVGVELDDPISSSLATFLIECALTKRVLDSGVTPNLALGSSIGIFASCVLARCFDEENAVRVIAGLGRIFLESCSKGCMIAVFDGPQAYHDSALLKSAAELAGVNFQGGFVISLPGENLPAVEEYLKRTLRTFQVLPVSRAYHSRWIDAARAPALDLLATLDSKPPGIPVVCCSKARELPSISADDLWDAIRDRMSFQQSVARLEELAVHRYVDLGPSGTMATFLKYGLPATSRSQRFTILSPFGKNANRLQGAITALTDLGPVRPTHGGMASQRPDNFR